jgi:hypothetical protein
MATPSLPSGAPIDPRCAPRFCSGQTGADRDNLPRTLPVRPKSSRLTPDRGPQMQAAPGSLSAPVERGKPFRRQRIPWSTICSSRGMGGSSSDTTSTSTPSARPSSAARSSRSTPGASTATSTPESARAAPRARDPNRNATWTSARPERARRSDAANASTSGVDIQPSLPRGQLSEVRPARDPGRWRGACGCGQGGGSWTWLSDRRMARRLRFSGNWPCRCPMRGHAPSLRRSRPAIAPCPASRTRVWSRSSGALRRS